MSKPKTQHCYHKNTKHYENPNILAEFIAGQLKHWVLQGGGDFNCLVSGEEQGLVGLVGLEPTI